MRRSISRGHVASSQMGKNFGQTCRASGGPARDGRLAKFAESRLSMLAHDLGGQETSSS